MRIVKGDATEPEKRPTVIAHICNDKGGWGKGFVVALSRKWAEPERAYRNIRNYNLGTIQIVQVEENLYVCNMMAQHGFPGASNPVPIQYDHLATCLLKLDGWCKEHDNMSVTMPKIGTGYARGKWDRIQEIIGETLTVDVTVYEF